MKVALLQTAPVHDPNSALAVLDTTASQAAAAGADLLVTPEMWLGGYNIGAARINALASRAPEHRQAVAEIAQRHTLAIIAGLTTAAAPRPHNSAIAVAADGAEVAHYGKTHLFGDIDRRQFSQGPTAPSVFTLNGWQLGLAICYDIEFAEHARGLALQGAELILTPTANMQEFPSVSKRIVPTRAEENGLYVAYCNYVGQEGDIRYGGCSCVCAPDGSHLAEASANSSEILYAQLKRDVLLETRRKQDYLKDCRQDLYPMHHPASATT